MSFKPIPNLSGTQANFTGNITSAGNLTVEGDITMGGSDVLTGVSESSVTQHQAALTLASGQITGALGYTPLSGVSESNVTQHQAALSITESQISDLGSYITSVRTVTAGGNTLGAGETLAFGVGGDNIKVTESGGAVTIAVDGSAELPTDTIPNLATSKINSGTFANARISQGSVTQHQAALTLASGQITGALGYTPLSGVSESNVTQHQAALTLASGQITGALGFTPISTETDDQTLDEVLAQGNTSSRNITAGIVTGSNGVRGQDVQIGVTDSAMIDTSAGDLDIGSAGGTTILGDTTISITNKLGIGTTSPEQKLHVYQGTAKFESTNGSDNSLQLGRSDNANLWQFNHAGNDLRIRNDGGSGYDIMFGVSSGGGTVANKVGILTASPSHQLDVNGTLRSVGDATFDANVNAAGVITTGGNTEAEVKSWLHVGRMWSFNGLPGFSKDSGAAAARSDGVAPGSLSTGAAASRRAMMTLIRNTYNDYGGYSGAGPDYSRAIGASIKLAFFANGQNSSIVRLLVGSPSSVSSTPYADEDPLSNHGFGVEFRRGSGSTYEWRVFGHNGTSLTASAFTSTGITYTVDPRTIAVYSDGAGNITAYTALYGSTSYTTATTTGGPTATAGGMSTYTSIQVATNDSSYVSGASAKCVFMGANFYAE